MTAYRTILLAGLCAMAFTTSARADTDDIKALKEAKISLIEAIEIAEAHKGGMAMEAKIEDDEPTPVFEVYIVHGDQVVEVDVNGLTGEIIEVEYEE